MSIISIIHIYTAIVFITLAGLPTTTELSGISFTTTEPAPIVTLLPIFTPPIITTLAPSETLSPIVGIPFLPEPNVVQCIHLKFFPMLSAFKIVEYEYPYTRLLFSRKENN